MQLGTTDMWEQNIYEAFSVQCHARLLEACASKCSQLRLATQVSRAIARPMVCWQVVKMILKIDDVITSGDAIDE